MKAPLLRSNYCEPVSFMIVLRELLLTATYAMSEVECNQAEGMLRKSSVTNNVSCMQSLQERDLCAMYERSKSVQFVRRALTRFERVVPQCPSRAHREQY